MYVPGSMYVGCLGDKRSEPSDDSENIRYVKNFIQGRLSPVSSVLERTQKNINTIQGRYNQPGPQPVITTNCDPSLPAPTPRRPLAHPTISHADLQSRNSTSNLTQSQSVVEDSRYSVIASLPSCLLYTSDAADE